MSHCQQKTLEMRLASIYLILVSLLLLVAALFITAILPSLLLKYFYAGQKLVAEPKLLEYIPLVSFAIAILYFVYALVATTLTEMKIRRMSANCQDCQHHTTEDDLTEEELAELEAIVDEAIAEKSAPKKTQKKRTRAKKTSKK